MFSGIVQNQAFLVKRQKRQGQIRMAFKLKKKENRLRAGESIAVEGVCLTASKVGNQRFEADVIAETLRATTLENFHVGDTVNVERSLKVGDSISGHFVSGHVDGRGRIKKVGKKGRDYIFEIQASEKILRFLALKGSIAVDGISLTVQEVADESFKVAIIPYTYQETTLRNKKAGDGVNLEVDLITRYLNVLNQDLKANPESKLDLSRLKQQGF